METEEETITSPAATTETETPAKKKAGFVVLVGRSNVGKSTLLNALVGTKVAITSPKPQTTRQRIQGILHDPRGQAVFVDTPGIFEMTHDVLTKKLNATVKDSLRDIDVILYVVDPTRSIGNEEHIVLRMLENAKAPIILIINKTDLRDPPFLSSYRALESKFAAMLDVSGLRGRGLKPLVDKVFELLPEGDAMYPEYQFTNVEHNAWLAELIREKVFIQLHEEIPYSTTVEIREMEKRTNGVLYIKAAIITKDERYKGMIVGSGGQKIKEIGWASRKEFEQILNTKVYLELEVETDPHWIERMPEAL